MEEFKIGVVGTGYVGLVTGACLAHIGHHVTCVDKDADRIGALKNGRTPIYEPGLDDLVVSGARRGRLDFTTDLAQGVRGMDVLFIAVDTPQGEDGAADITNVAAVAQGVGRVLAQESDRSRPLVVVNKSTVPVGTGEYVSMLIQEGAEGAPVDYQVVSNPEFLREGSAVRDSLFPDRIVLGSDKRDALETMRQLYEPIITQTFPTQLDPRPKTAVPVVSTDLVSAEMIKYAANTFLATKISFINEISTICDLVGADIQSVSHGIGLDGRIGPRFLNAGIGWGGSCFTKDVAALRSITREYDHQPVLLDAAVTVNERQWRAVITHLQRELHTLKGKRVALLGLAFKPNTDDLRGAPSLEIARTLGSLGARVTGYDPVAGRNAAQLGVQNLQVVFDPYKALREAHAAVLVTEWREFQELDFARAAELMNSPALLIDGRNALDPNEIVAAGLRYQGFGRSYRNSQHP